MNEDILIALIAVVPTTLAVILGYLASRRSTRQLVTLPLIQALRRLDAKIERVDVDLKSRLDRLAEGLGGVAASQADVRERVARLEGEQTGGRERLWVPPDEAL